jgi:thymidylate kinase
MFIVIEGVGKAEMASWLADHIRRKAGCDVLQLAFPSESPAGKVAQAMLDPNTTIPGRDALQSALIADYCGASPAICAHIRGNGVVVAQSWYDFSAVLGLLDDVNPEWLAGAHSMLPDPDLCILLDPGVPSIRMDAYRERWRSGNGKVYVKIPAGDKVALLHALERRAAQIESAL